MIRPLHLFLSFSTLALAQPATTPLFWPDKNGPTMNGIVPEADAKRLPLTQEGVRRKKGSGDDS